MHLRVTLASKSPEIFGTKTRGHRTPHTPWMGQGGLPSWLLHNFPLHIPTSSSPFPGHSRANEEIHELIQLLPLRAGWRLRSLSAAAIFKCPGSAGISQQWDQSAIPASLSCAGREGEAQPAHGNPAPKISPGKSSSWRWRTRLEGKREEGKKKKKIEAPAAGMGIQAGIHPGGELSGADPGLILTLSSSAQPQNNIPPNYCYAHNACLQNQSSQSSSSLAKSH